MTKEQISEARAWIEDTGVIEREMSGIPFKDALGIYNYAIRARLSRALDALDRVHAWCAEQKRDWSESMPAYSYAEDVLDVIKGGA
jgi:hypothetical protein